MPTNHILPADCPRRETLRDLVLGHFRPDVIDSLGEHIGECGPCQRALDEFAAQTDPFIDTLRERVEAEQYRTEGPLAAAVDKIRSPSSIV